MGNWQCDIKHVRISRVSSLCRQTFNVVQTRPYTIISKYHARGTPIWVYVVSSIGGLLALVLITFGLYKVRNNYVNKLIV